jgi:SAM-dependent methyltransferase
VNPARKIAIFAATRRAVERGSDFLYALHGVLWLGLLRRAELNQLTAASFSNSSEHPSEQSQVYNRSGLNAWERAALLDYFASCRSFLVGGAGGGREVIALCRQNVRADGFECSPPLLRLATTILQEERLDGRIVSAELDEVPADLGTYDGGIVGFGVYMHVAGRANRVRFLKDFARHLSPGAPLLVSFLDRGESRRDRYLTAVARMIQRLRGVEQDVEVGDMISDCFVHRFTESEIAAELRDAGLELVCFRPQPFAHAIAKSRC